jgi:hypothetical protein
MNTKIDYVKKRYRSMFDKTLENTLAHKLKTQFPRIGGPRILQLCAKMILEVINDHIRPFHTIKHGQILWMAYDINDPPAKYKKTADSLMKPVVLQLSNAEDIQAIIDRETPGKQHLRKALRLCNQSYKQGALLSTCDLSELLTISQGYASKIICNYEKEKGEIVPRRSTIHDMGSGLTHKRIICRKRYIDGKSPDQIAQETYHDLQSVDRYLSQYDRVRHCYKQGMSLKEIAFTLNCSVRLVEEYIAIDEEIEGKND